MKKASVLLVALALALFGLAACGGDDDDDGDTTAVETEATETQPAGGGGPGGTVDLSAAPDGSLAFDQESATASAGSITVNFDNPAAIQHDVVIEDQGGAELGRTDLISNSETSTTVNLEPGSYTFYCSVPGHREGGMEGTLTVN